MDNGIGALTPFNGGDVTVSPTVGTLYTATFLKGNGMSIVCTASVEVEGTPPAPAVTLSFNKVPNEQPLAFVHLSQIPYTGFANGENGTPFFWTFLVIWSGLISYMLVVREGGRKTVHAVSDVVSGLMQRHNTLSENITHTDFDEQVGFENALERTIGDTAHQSGILISNEGIQLIIRASNSDEVVSLQILQNVLTHANKLYEQEDGWIHLTKDRVVLLLSQGVATDEIVARPSVASSVSRNEISSSPYNTTNALPVFIGWLCDGEGEKVFEFLRRISAQGSSSNEFITGVVCHLDDTYRNRIEGGCTVDSFVREKTQSMSNDDLQQFIGCLARGIDHSYDTSHTGVKMACVRALEWQKKRQTV